MRHDYAGQTAITMHLVTMLELCGYISCDNTDDICHVGVQKIADNVYEECFLM